MKNLFLLGMSKTLLSYVIPNVCLSFSGYGINCKLEEKFHFKNGVIIFIIHQEDPLILTMLMLRLPTKQLSWHFGFVVLLSLEEDL